MKVDADYCYRKNNLIIYKELDDGPALIDPYRRVLVRFNPAAQAIWQLLDGEHSVAAIIDILKNEFEVDIKILEKDVIVLLKDLIKREIIN
jgi:hypothetical protein